MDISDAQDIIKTALTTGFTDQETEVVTREIANFPDRPEQYKLTHPIGALLVYYLRSQYQREPINHAAVNQPKDIIINVRVKNRNLNTNEGAVADVQQVIDSLQGVDISSYNTTRPGRLYIIEDRFIDYDPANGIWDYEVTIGVPSEQYQDTELL